MCQRRMIDPSIPNVYEAGYYVHDRLGSVPLVVGAVEEPGGVVVQAFNSTTYTPFGSFYEGQCVENIDNPFKFTGQWHDVEIDQYHLRARQYDPTMMRFTSRDPIVGNRQEPLTLHRYLYCWSSPILYTDSSGEYGIGDAIIAGYEMHSSALFVTAYGVEEDNDFMFELGLFMDKLINFAMVAAIITPSGDGCIDPSKSTKENARLAMKNPRFSKWFDKVYKPQWKISGGKGNRHDPDLSPEDILEALGEWLGNGNSM